MTARFVIVAGPVRRHGASPSFGWRLIGANNRPLGLSWATVPDLDTCREEIDRRVRRLSEDTVRLTADLATGLWSWQAHDADGPVAVSARAYQRQRECRYSATSFLAALETAPEVSLVVALSDVAGSARAITATHRRSLSLSATWQASR